MLLPLLLLCLFVRFLGARNARSVLRRAGAVFPGVLQVTLFHANGWCDPVQVGATVKARGSGFRALGLQGFGVLGF